MSKSTVCILVLILLGCAKKPGSDNQGTADCQPFFSFNRLDHFHIEIDEDSISYFQDIKDTTHVDPRLFDLLFRDSPMTISDSVKLLGIESFGYTSRQVAETDFDNINQLFCERLVTEGMKVNLCIPKFRDILIFRNGTRIVGFVKLCFDCNQSVIAGTDKETIQFGQAGEFEKLTILLKVEKIEN